MHDSYFLVMNHRKTAVLPAAGLVWVLTAGAAHGRAGGGEGYSGGDDFSGGGGGGGGGDGFSLHLPDPGGMPPGRMRGGNMSTTGMIILLLVILVAIWFLNRRKASRRRETGALPDPPRSEVSGGRSFAEELGLTDRGARGGAGEAPIAPSAEGRRLLRAMPRLFADIQAAWSERDLERVHRDVSDGVFSRWDIQLKLMRREGRHNRVEDPRLLQARIVGEREDGPYESVDVHVVASVVDYDVTEGEAPPQPRPAPTRFEEIWSFTRKKQSRETQSSENGAPTLGAAQAKATDAGAWGQSCPNCGAGLAGSQGVKCASCGALLNSGAYDWVLAEITQAEAWHPPARGLAFGVAGTEGQLSGQELEDRASTVFVRLIEALLERRPALMRPYAAESVVHALEAGRHPLQGIALQRLAVGKVEVEGVQTQDHRTDVRVRVLYASGRNTLIASPQRHSLTLIFSREIPAPGKTDENPSQPTRPVGAGGLNTLNCPVCGAPVGHSEQARCEYCGEVLNHPEHHWVLTGIE